MKNYITYIGSNMVANSTCNHLEGIMVGLYNTTSFVLCVNVPKHNSFTANKLRSSSQISNIFLVIMIKSLKSKEKKPTTNKSNTKHLHFIHSFKCFRCYLLLLTIVVFLSSNKQADGFFSPIKYDNDMFDILV